MVEKSHLTEEEAQKAAGFLNGLAIDPESAAALVQNYKAVNR